jgi:glucarate dehydratase
VPVSDILGGRVRDHVPFASYLFFRYANGNGTSEVRTCDQLVAEAKALKAQHGFTSHKLKGGVFPPKYELECYRAIAESLPGDSFRFDPNAVWSVEQAIWFARRIEDLNNDYLEDPVFGTARYASHAGEGAHAAGNEHGGRWLRAAGGQCVGDRRRRHPPRHTFWGGIRPCVKAAGICEAFQLSVAVHSSGELGIQLATMLHLGAVLPISHSPPTPITTISSTT